MTLQHLNDQNSSLTELLRQAGEGGVLLEAADSSRFALMPLDDDMLDYLIERSPRFAEECAAIRARMGAGQVRTHDEVRLLFAE